MRSLAGTLAAPFPWFGYVAPRCNGQSQSLGCRPVRFVALLVVHLFVARACSSAATHWSWKAILWTARWSALLKSSKLSSASLSLFSSRWWTPNPAGIGPFANSHTTCARNFQVFGSATLTHARCSPPRLWRVRIFTVPTGSVFDGGEPATNLPCAFFMGAF